MLCICFVIFSGILIAETDSEKEHKLIAKAVAELDVAQKWIVENLIEHHYSRDIIKKDARRFIYDKFNVRQYTMSYYMDQEEALVKIIIKSRGIYYTIHCFERLNVDGKYYEYWNVNIDGRDWAGVNRTARFIITESDSIHGVRRIIKEEDQFFLEYVIDEKNIISFPVDDNWKMARLEPWFFPLNYENSDLDEYLIFSVDRVESVPGVFSIKDIIWDKRKLTDEEIAKFREAQTKHEFAFNPGNFKFPSEK